MDGTWVLLAGAALFAGFVDAVAGGGGMVQVPLSDQEGPQTHPNEDVLALHEALEALAVCDERQAQILEMRFFGGMTVDEVAAALFLSRTTIEREERMAKWWLRKKLS